MNVNSRLERRNIDSQAAFHPGMIPIGRVWLELAGGEGARFPVTAIVPALFGCCHAFAAVEPFRYHICVHDWSLQGTWTCQCQSVQAMASFDLRKDLSENPLGCPALL